jgi:FlaA1/EpsC-like NDP-sugar epimerase
MTFQMTGLPFDLRHDRLQARIVGREVSYFAEDLEAAARELKDMIRGARVLVIGGAGSIGFQTIRTVVEFEPAVLHIIDHNENGLAEAIRSLRSAERAPRVGELLSLPFDYGGAPFRLWFQAQADSYDIVLNFAALKHVRSEKDPYSILAMLETNVMRLDVLARLVEAKPGTRRLFCVSTDKAANPSSMMGATKRLMEHAMFSDAIDWPQDLAITSARFANVALSNGSLLQSWENRLSMRQPMACPEGCRRFFVTLPESGHLCTLAALLGPHRSIMVPTLEPETHLALLQDVVVAFLETKGLTPHFTHDEEEARRGVEAHAAAGRWPVLLTPLDTAGEKPYEEFVGAGESRQATRFTSLDRVPYLAPADAASFPAFLDDLRALLAPGSRAELTIDRLREMIAGVETAFRHSHRASSKSLDQRI